MDHTFVRYKMRNFVKLVNQATSIYLVAKKKYPQEIFVANEDEAKKKYKMSFRVVFDHKTGVLLKIGSNKLIMRAYFGWTQLTKEEIIRLYGKNPILENFEILSARHADFTNLHEFYGTSLVPLVAQIVDLKARGTFEMLNKRDYYQIMADVNEALDYNYGIADLEAFRQADYRGYFYPKLLTEPRHYVNKTHPDVIDRLRKLKERGVKIFLASNNYFEVADLMMTEAMGPDWLNLFDFVIFNASKPKFFTSETPTAFLDLNRQPVADPTSVLLGKAEGLKKVLLGGHAEHINQFLQEHVRKDFKVLFFGDTIVTDCIYAFDTYHQNYWDTVLIMEELQELEHGYPEKEYYGYWQFWGSAILDKSLFSGVDKTIIFEFADNLAQRTFSKVDGPECIDFLTI
jgi:HAD superfamily 5'-nucleotidase-like hydrolase